MFIATPIRDEKNQVIAALTLRIQASGRISDILQQGRIGASGGKLLSKLTW